MPPKQEKKRLRGSSSSADGPIIEEDGGDSEILKSLESIKHNMEAGFSRINDDIEALKGELKSDIKSVSEELNEATKSLTAAWEEVAKLKAKNLSLQEQLDSATEENANLKKDFEALKIRVVRQKDYSRRENLPIYNVPESPQETNGQCIQKVKQVLAELGLPDVNFHAIHRTGKPITSAGAASVDNECPRPILARFVSRMDADAVWLNRKELLKSPRFSKVMIDKDLSQESARERAKLRAAYKKAKELNIDQVFIKGIAVGTQRKIYQTTLYQRKCLSTTILVTHERCFMPCFAFLIIRDFSFGEIFPMQSLL